MKITEEHLAKMCACEITTCKKPHTVKELENQLQLLEPLDEDVETCCPKCNVSTDVSTFVYKNKLEGYCMDCNINFDVKTGKEIDVLDSNTEIIDEVEERKRPKHTMIYDGKFYQCDTCSFETQFMSEVFIHESKSPITIEDKKDDSLHYISFKSQNLWACHFCKQEFNTWKDATAHETPEGTVAYKKLPIYGSSYTTSNYKHCTHKPQQVIFGEGWEIFAGRRWDCEDQLNKFDIVLNLTGSRISKKHEIPIKALKKWESREKFTEICLDWPDRGIVSLPKQFWADLAKHIETNKLKMVVFCVGGHGRTGTAVASLLITILGWEPKVATEWVWENYCDQAIETDAQVNYVYNLVGQTYTPPKKETAVSQINNQTTIIGGGSATQGALPIVSCDSENYGLWNGD